MHAAAGAGQRRAGAASATAITVYRAYRKLEHDGIRAPSYKALSVRTGKAVHSVRQAAHVLRSRYGIELVFAHHEQRTRTRVLEEQIQKLVADAKHGGRTLTYTEIGATLGVTMIDIVRAKYHLRTKRGVDLGIQRDTSKDFTRETSPKAVRARIAANRQRKIRRTQASSPSREDELKKIDQFIAKNGVKTLSPGHALGVVRSSFLNRTI